MKRELMEVLACPVCKTGLSLEVEEIEGDEVASGTLTCERLGEAYRIEDGVPVLVTPEYSQSPLS